MQLAIAFIPKTGQSENPINLTDRFYYSIIRLKSDVNIKILVYITNKLVVLSNRTKYNGMNNIQCYTKTRKGV